MTKKFQIICRACNRGWIMLDVAFEEQATEVTIFPRFLCLTCGASEEARGKADRAAGLVAIVQRKDPQQ